MNGSGSFTNNGVINASVSGGTITIDPSSWTAGGTGLIEASSGGTLYAQTALGSQNFSSGTLINSEYEVGANSKIKLTTASPITAINAAVIYDGPGGHIVAGSAASTDVQGTLTTIDAGNGDLAAFAGGNPSFSTALTNNGIVNIDDVSSLSATGGFTQAGNYAVINGTLTSSVNITGGAVYAGGNATNTTPTQIVGNVTNAATLVVGGSNVTGQQVNITGTYAQNSAGTLEMSIAGTTAGVSTSNQGYGQLDVGGTASLNGTLQVSLANGYTPAAGSNYQLVTSSVVGHGHLQQRQFALGLGRHGDAVVRAEDRQPERRAAGRHLDWRRGRRSERLEQREQLDARRSDR